MMPKINSRAPQFSLLDQNGETVSLKDFSDKWLLLYFYPKDDTPGCTTEACTLRDNYDKFKKNKITIVGVSKDDSKSHQKFVSKFLLPFTLLADTDLLANKAYGVWVEKKFMGRKFMGTRRTSFLIGPDQKIKKIYEDVKPAEHAAEILSDFETFK